MSRGSSSSRAAGLEDALRAGSEAGVRLLVVTDPPPAPIRSPVTVQAPAPSAAPPAPAPAPAPSVAVQHPPAEPAAPPAPAVEPPTPTPTPVRPAGKRSKTGPASAREREGWTAIQFFAPGVAKVQMKMLQYENGRGNFEDQMREALDDLFSKYGMKRVCGTAPTPPVKRS